MYYNHYASSFLLLFRRIFRENAGWDVSVVDIRQNAQKDYHTDIDVFIVPNGTETLISSQDILKRADANTDLISALHNYGLVSSEVRGSISFYCCHFVSEYLVDDLALAQSGHQNNICISVSIGKKFQLEIRTELRFRLNWNLSQFLCETKSFLFINSLH